MIIDIIALKGCGIKADKRLQKIVIRAENVADQEKLYKLAGLIRIAEHSILEP